MARSPNQEKARLEQAVPADRTNPTKQQTSTSPLSAALLRLPQHYFKALVKPSVGTFTQQKDIASWRLVWIQLLAWAVLDAALGVVVNLISPPSTSTAFLRFFALASSYGLIIVVPILYFLLMGIVYLLSRYIGGQGTFLEQCNTSLSLQFPLGILSKLLALIPGVGRILNIVLSLYGIVLQVVVIMAVHRLGKGKAIASVFIPLVTIGALAGAVLLLMKR